MSDMIIRGGDLLPPLLSTEKTPGGKEAGKSFGNVLQGIMKDINKLQLNADEAIAKVQLDNTGSIHEAMIALEKADLSFRTMMQVRNKILDAYQEIMRMQV
jgi:flagellar hook-basal body complex protein FliE